MPSSRAVTVAGLAAAGGVGYYLYQAGGSPSVAEKKFEHDAAKLSSTIRAELPGREKEVKTQGKIYAEEAGQKIDRALEEARAQTRQFDKTLEQYRAEAEKKIEAFNSEARKEVNQVVDKFDHTVEKKASEAKGWFSGWFGGSK